ncbi:unnamed protein product [Aphanomyces euteiches]
MALKKTKEAQIIVGDAVSAPVSQKNAMVHDFLKYVKDHKQTKSAIRNEMSDMMRSILFLEKKWSHMLGNDQ